MLSSMKERLLKEVGIVIKDLDRAGNEEDVFYYNGIVDMLQHFINALDTNIINNCNVIPHKEAAIIYMQGIGKAVSMFLEEFFNIVEQK